MSPLLLRLLLCSLALTTYGQGMSMSAEEEEMLEEMGIKGAPMGRKNLDPQAAPFKSDLKYIYCGVCRKMVEQAHVKAQEILTKRFEQLKKKKRKRDTTEFDGEGAVQEFTEKMCNPLKARSRPRAGHAAAHRACVASLSAPASARRAARGRVGRED